jgi:hypothetical protein
VRLTVRDTGHGIAPEILERIFDPFFTTKGVGEGTGMGLAVVHGIVASHGGAIAVASTPRHGTTFEIYLPRIHHPLHLEITDEEPIPHGHERLSSSMTTSAGRLVQEILVQLGYDVVVPASSVGALETFRGSTAV